MRAEEGGSELPLGGAQQRLVLGLLIAAGGRVVTTEQIMDRVWPGELPDQARKTIQVHVSRLRKALGGVIVSEGGGYRLGADVETDLADFERLAAEGRGLLADRPDRAGALFRQALELWRGAPFGDLAHEEGLLGEVSRLEELRLGVLEDRLDAEIAVGRTAVEELEDLMEQHPLRERLRALHMTALYRSGRQSEALVSYRRFREMLLDSAGLDPSPELQDLELRILQHDPSLGPALPSPVVPLTATPPPVRYASFVGRDNETEAVGVLLESHRLVTLVGPGGIGKSSLAAAYLGSPGGPVARLAWVDVETAPHNEVADAIAVAMGLRPFSTSDPLEVIVVFARERPHLLVLDGCEPHGDEVAGLVDRMLAACPEMRILATSREALGLPGEKLLRVGALEADTAASLFRDRLNLDADVLDSAAEHITAACEALDGIPLAIELAAGRLRSMPTSRFAEALADQVGLLRRSRPGGGRHGSLAAALDASYRLLDDDQQRAFRRLSVFHQRFEAGAAPVMVDAESADRVVDRLVEVSLVQPPDADGTYRMLEPIRQYARSLLDESGEADQARDRHARWFAERSRQIATEMLSPRLREARSWVLRNRFELAAALDWSLQRGHPETGVAILAAVGRRISNLGYGGLFLPTAVDVLRHPSLEPSPELAVAMTGVTHLLYLNLDPEGAVRLITDAATLAEALGDPLALGVVLARKAPTLGWRGPLPTEGRLEVQRAVAMQEEAGAVPLMDWVNLSFEGSWAGDLEMADTYARKGLEWEQEHVGYTSGDFECALSLAAFVRGDLEESITYGRRAALGRTAQGSLLHARNDWFHLASNLLYAGRDEEAAEALERALELGEAVGIHTITATGPRERLAAARGDMDTVLRLGREWFEEVLGVEGPFSPDVPDSQTLLFGDVSRPSPLLTLLLPLTEALMWRSEVERPCRFAHAAPDLMAQCAYRGWEAIGEAERWRTLAARCGDPAHETSMTMEQAFEEAAGLLGFAIP